MRFHVTKLRDVVVATLLTTVGCILLVEFLVYVLVQGAVKTEALRLAPIIAILTALPVSLFIWSQVRRNMSLSLELQRLVDRDRLTDVATRDFFFARMAALPDRFGVSLMVDIDHFKMVNDTYGHQAGDAVISRVAEILRQQTRASDIVCRYGGEEFVIFLSDQDPNAGYEVAERMRKAIDSDILAFQDEELHVTVSIGGSLKESLADVNLAILQADEALHRAKTLGRNRTVFSKPPKADHPAALAQVSTSCNACAQYTKIDFALSQAAR